MSIKFYTGSLFLIYLFTQTTINAQKDTIYYDQNWKKTTKSNVSFYRPLPLQIDGDRTLFKDYYKDGTLQFEGWQKRKDSTQQAFFGSDSYYFDGKVVWYYANGNKKTEHNYKNGKENGKEMLYYKNGAVESENEMIDDERQFSKSYNKEGKLLAELQYKNGYPEEGVSNCFISYKNGEKIGEKLYYENTTQLAYEKTCPDEGCYNENTATYYSKSGAVIQKNTYKNDDIINGAAIAFFKGEHCGFVKGIKSITRIEHENFNGPYTRFDTIGKIIYSGTYKTHEPYDGTFETSKEYLTYVTSYTKGIKNGKETVWNKDKKIAEGMYVEGVKQDGTFVEERQFTGWSKTPIIINLKAGKEEGKQKYYNTARDMTMGYYHAKAGVKDGAYAVFYYDGEVLAEATYKDGKPFDGAVLFNDEYRYYKNGERLRENVMIDPVEQERMQAFSKGSDTIEGVYNMGGFETAGSLVFLDNHQFFFKLIVGSMDLFTYGNYHLKNGTLKLQVPLEQKQDFVVYGGIDSTLKDTVQFQYYNYNARSKPVLQLNKKWYALENLEQPGYTRSSRNVENFKVDLKELTSLKIGIKNSPTAPVILKSVFETETLEGYNNFIIAYNVNNTEIRQFEKATFKFNGEKLQVDGKERNKRTLTEVDKEFVMDYIIENRSFPHVIKNGMYKKIKLTANPVTQKIKKYTQLVKEEE